VDIAGVSGSTCETLRRLCSEPDDGDGLPDALKRATAVVTAEASTRRRTGMDAEKFKGNGEGSDAVSAIAHLPGGAFN